MNPLKCWHMTWPCDFVCATIPLPTAQHGNDYETIQDTKHYLIRYCVVFTFIQSWSILPQEVGPLILVPMLVPLVSKKEKPRVNNSSSSQTQHWSKSRVICLEGPLLHVEVHFKLFACLIVFTLSPINMFLPLQSTVEVVNKYLDLSTALLPQCRNKIFSK